MDGWVIQRRARGWGLCSLRRRKFHSFSGTSGLYANAFTTNAMDLMCHDLRILNYRLGPPASSGAPSDALFEEAMRKIPRMGPSAVRKGHWPDCCDGRRTAGSERVRARDHCIAGRARLI